MSELKKVITELESMFLYSDGASRWLVKVDKEMCARVCSALCAETKFTPIYIEYIMQFFVYFNTDSRRLSRDNFEHIKTVLKDYV